MEVLIIDILELYKKLSDQDKLNLTWYVIYNSIKNNELGKEIKTLTKRIKSYLFN